MILKKLKSYSPGMTLIEIMIVTALIGGIMGMAAYIMFPGDDARLRDEATRLAGTIKYLYNEAAIKNQYYRLVFDLDERSYRAEVSSEPFYVSMPEEDQKKNTPKATPRPQGDQQGEAPPEAAFAEVEALGLEPVQLATGTKIKDILVTHLPERVETGKVELYFLPNGWTEPAVIHLSNDEEDLFYSLEVNPLTGRAKIFGEYLEINPEQLKGTEAVKP